MNPFTEIVKSGLRNLEERNLVLEFFYQLGEQGEHAISAYFFFILID